MGNDQGPQIQGDRQYQTQRERGKEKAAGTASPDREVTAHPSGSGPRYEDWTKERLYGKAREVGIAGRSRMSRNELIAALRDAT